MTILTVLKYILKNRDKLFVVVNGIVQLIFKIHLNVTTGLLATS